MYSCTHSLGSLTCVRSTLLLNLAKLSCDYMRQNKSLITHVCVCVVILLKTQVFCVEEVLKTGVYLLYFLHWKDY